MHLNYCFLVQKVSTYLFNLISPDLNQNITIFCHKDPMSCRQYVEFCINILLYQPTHIHGHKTTKVCTQKVSNIPGNDSRLNSNSRCNSCLISHTHNQRYRQMIQEQQQRGFTNKNANEDIANNEKLDKYSHTQVQYAMLIPPSCSWRILAFDNARDCNV